MKARGRREARIVVDVMNVEPMVQGRSRQRSELVAKEGRLVRVLKVGWSASWVGVGVGDRDHSYSTPTQRQT